MIDQIDSASASDIQSLARRVQDLENSISFWNNKYVWAVGLTVVLAAAVFVIQFWLIRQGTKLSKAQSELTAAKDAKTATDLADKDIEIGKAKADAAKAGQKAGEAELKTAEIARDNIQLQAAVEAGRAAIEAEKDTRIELEQSLAPRQPLAYKVDHGKSNIDPLKPFAGINVSLRYKPGQETEAGSLRSIIGFAGWTLVEDGYDSNIFSAGVVVRKYLTDDMAKAAGNDPDEKFSEAAALAMAAFLNSQGWDSIVESGSRASWMPQHVARNSVRIEIGAKPQPYFEPQQVKEAREKMKAVQDELSNRIKQK